MEVNVNKPIFYGIKYEEIADSGNPPLSPAYTLSLSALNLYSGFLGPVDEAHSIWIFLDSQDHIFDAKTISKRNLDYNNLYVIKKDQSHPTVPHRVLSSITMSTSWNLNDQFIHHIFVHASHQCIILMIKLGICTGLPKFIPTLSHPYRACIISKIPRLTHHPNVSK